MKLFIAFASIASFGALSDVLPPSAPGGIGLDWAPILNTTGFGGLLLFFLIKLEPRLKEIAAAIDRSSRSSLIAVIAFGNATPVEKAQAQGILTEIEDAKRTREGTK